MKEKKEARLFEVQRQHDREKRERELELMEEQDREREAAMLGEVDQMVKEALEKGTISKQELPLMLDNFLSQFATQ